MEFAALAILYVHLLACCVAIGLVLTQDAARLGQLLKGDAVHHDETRFGTLQRTLSVSLLVLWLTGAVLVMADVDAHGMGVLFNPKLHAKILVVVVLTLNGLALDRWILPALRAAGALLDLHVGARMFAAFCGSLSAVSWCYAAMLGIARPLDWQYPVPALLGAYMPLVLLGMLGMILIMGWGQYRRKAMMRRFDQYEAGVPSAPAVLFRSA
jgi:hypothetical protein